MTMLTLHPLGEDPCIQLYIALFVHFYSNGVGLKDERKFILSMKEGSLFCFVVMRSSEPGCFRSLFFMSLESSQPGEVHGA